MSKVDVNQHSEIKTLLWLVECCTFKMLDCTLCLVAKNKTKKHQVRVISSQWSAVNLRKDYNLSLSNQSDLNRSASRYHLAQFFLQAYYNIVNGSIYCILGTKTCFEFVCIGYKSHTSRQKRSCMTITLNSLQFYQEVMSRIKILLYGTPIQRHTNVVSSLVKTVNQKRKTPK